MGTVKFCKPRYLEYKGLNGNVTSLHYITKKDIIEFHNTIFGEKIIEFLFNKPTINNNFYYEDYKFAARQADSFLNQV